MSMPSLTFTDPSGNQITADGSDFSPNSGLLQSVLQASPLAGLAAIGWGSRHDPIYMNLPTATKAFQNKYAPGSEMSSLVSSVPEVYRNSILDLDQKRALQGQNPLTKKQTINVLKTAIEGKPVTPEPKHSFFGSVVSDIKTLGASVPKIPSALVHEALAIPTLPAYLQEHPNPVDILQAPGVRLIPGAFTAHNILSGHPEQLLQHPVFTALDVLPVAKETGATAALAEKLAPVTETLSRTKAGQILTDTFGKSAKQIAEMQGLQALKLDQDVNLPINPKKRIAPAAFPEQTAWTEATRAAANIANNSEKMFGIRTMSPESAQVMRSFTTGDVSGLSGNQLALREALEPIRAEYERILTDDQFLKSIDIGGTPELFDRRTAARIYRYRRVSQNAELMGRTREFVDPNDARNIIDPATAQKHLQEIWNRADPTIKPVDRTTSIEQARLLERGYVTALRHQGYDTSWYDAINRDAKKLKITELQRRTNIDTQLNNMVATAAPANPVRSVPDLLSALDERAKLGDKKVIAIQENIKSGNYARARQLSREVSKRTLASIPDIEQIVDELSSHRASADFISKTKDFNPRAVASKLAKTAKVEAESVPARFIPMVKDIVQQNVKEAYSSHPDFDKLIPLIAERNYELLPGFTSNDLARMTDEVKNTWQTLRDQLPADQQPVFIHQVTPDRVHQINARPMEHIVTESHLKERTFDNTPYTQDAAVALTHQGVERLRRIHSEALAENITSSFGVKLTDLMERYLPQARQLAAKGNGDVRTVLNDLIRRDYTTYDPEGIFTFSTPKLRAYQEEGMMIPKTVANTLQKMHTPPGGSISKLFDPLMRVFRTSVLPLSPRWHVNNVASGMIALMAEGGPEVLTKFGQAKEAIARGEIPLEAGVGTGVGSIPRDVAVSDYSFGKLMRQQFEDAKAGRATSGLRQGFKNVVQRSYELNEMVDDMYRAVAYLYGHDKEYAKLLKQGDLPENLAKEQAQQAGIALAKKVMPNWLNMTPIERTIIRQVFPFYGWVRHILKYALSYPVDHPTRAAIVGSLARAEFEDRNALPDKFLDYFFLGGMDKNGNIGAINTKSLNPFSDVSRYFTLAGFLGSTNPVISTVLRSAGFNPATGGPDLFPATRYDSTSGRLAAAVGNPIGNLIQSTVPQSRLLFDVLGANSTFKQQLRTDPGAAISRLQSYAGMPNLYNRVNLPQEQYKAELAREDAQDTALNNALKSGSDYPAANYPGLTPLLSQVRSLQASDLIPADYTPQAGMPSLLDIAQQTLLTRMGG